MSYRDDVDTLYTRAMILQKELDRANEELAARDKELATLRGPQWSAADTSPGMRALRDLPDPDIVLARLVDHEDRTPASPIRPSEANESLPGLPGVAAMSRAKVLERVRDRLAALDEEALVVIGTLVEELGDEAPWDKSELLERLRPIAQKITATYRRRH